MVHLDKCLSTQYIMHHFRMNPSKIEPIRHFSSEFFCENWIYVRLAETHRPIQNCYRNTGGVLGKPFVTFTPEQLNAC